MFFHWYEIRRNFKFSSKTVEPDITEYFGDLSGIRDIRRMEYLVMNKSVIW